MISYLLIILGIVFLYMGGNWFVEGASALAKRLGISSLVIGLTVVAFGTSAPELIVNIMASFQENSGMAFGNIIGSNLINTLLILGLAGVIAPLSVQSSTVWKEIPLSMLAVLVLVVLSNKIALADDSINVLTRVDGLILLFFFLIFVYYIFESIKNNKVSPSNKVEKYSGMNISLMLIGGLTSLIIGGRMTVDGAVSIARDMGISDFLISSTIIAAGTSLPELVTSVSAAIKKEMDISMGNIIGSNIFNIFLVMGISSTISPLMVPTGVNTDLSILAIATFLCFLFMFTGKKHSLERWEAIIFVTMYIGYVLFIIQRG
ncbi:MAG: K+dependent Na+ exchanger related-protein [Methanohalophilus sp. T328-1]|jgi:cation:H+ antiporter|uniref:Cation:H+ antiporter n=1 Tax=Methanohalophilus euhalobius TaxID=51203 RepID=A0A285F6E8_9EURY|nr:MULTISPECIES: calcium/sodium antiporter [Methanohalophilus]KXS44717.1 MAG: K+dependent Na+ exchanger related-protein [Methanohalophilus sp. T328-1]RSD33364.1 MAG: K+dependent Na+ exchanger related-protein [Methanohalophilus sp.]OBZ34260.1 MAG: sodium:proton exchanger [Methanohalophilus sp. DAL1]ODV49977.1 MAG: K+dependent Na+ exchanger related-protein [Methanohalophilus sp. 2-GBenrich]RXG34845.1 K+dependent Na+ exchanger related-protein [Methanohalophilus sp. WG1-DM]